MRANMDGWFVFICFGSLLLALFFEGSKKKKKKDFILYVAA